MNYETNAETTAAVATGLDQIAAILGKDLGLDVPARELRERADSLRTNCFRVVVVGDFSRGKSTLVNALLGMQLLPQKVTPKQVDPVAFDFPTGPHASIESAGARSGRSQICKATQASCLVPPSSRSSNMVTSPACDFAFVIT